MFADMVAAMPPRIFLTAADEENATKKTDTIQARDFLTGRRLTPY
jgi:hypothetical protein